MPAQWINKAQLFISKLPTPTLITLLYIWALIIYANSLLNPFIGDDIILITKNPIVQSLSNIPFIFTRGAFPDDGSGHGNNYYRPIVSTFFALLNAISFSHPFIFHLTQILIHATNVMLIFLIFKHFFPKHLSFILAAIFLVHPINTESVIYIASIQEPLFVLFGLIATHKLLATPAKQSPTYWITPLLCFSLLSKEIGLLFAILLPILGYLLHPRYLSNLLIQSSLAITIYFILRFGIAQIYFPQNPIAPIMTLDLTQRLLHIPAIITFYLKTYAYPQHLLVSQTWTISQPTSTNFYIPLLIILMLCFILCRNIFHACKAKSPQLIPLQFFSLWFLLGIGVHLQLIPLDQTVADRWFYFPFIGLLGITGSLLTSAQTYKPNIKGYIFSLPLIIIIALSIRVIHRNDDWHTHLKLYQHDIQHNPNSHQLETGLGTEYLKTQSHDLAEKHYLRANQLFPSYITHTNLGILYLKLPNYNQAITAFENALHFDPGNTNAIIYLAVAHYQLGNKQQAITFAQQAYAMQPNAMTQGILADMIKGKPIQIQ